MNNIVINSIMIIFVCITVMYSIYNIVLNKSLFNHIRNDYDKLNEDYKRSLLYQNIKNRYDTYTIEKTYADINITSFIEEVCTGFMFKNRQILELIKTIKNASSSCILLGVLGTFVGLSIMLLSVNTSDIINSLPASISSMQTAFITSICGIVCSIMINIALSRNDCENILVKLMLRLENILTSEITHSKGVNLEYKINDINDSIKKIGEALEGIEKFDEISKELKAFNKEFINGVESLKKLIDDSKIALSAFEQNIRKLDKQFSIMNLKFIKLFDKYDNQEDINKEILIDIKEACKNIYESTENQIKVRENLKILNEHFISSISQQNEIAEKYNNNIDYDTDLKKTINNLINTIESISNEVYKSINIDYYTNNQDEKYEEIYDIESLSELDEDGRINDK
ncbi:MAG: MotA/TolQ/ExbB proton channel family protein [Peptostreptococcaceae bacterium]